MDLVIAVKCFNILKWDFSHTQKNDSAWLFTKLFTGVRVCVCVCVERGQHIPAGLPYPPSKIFEQ